MPDQEPETTIWEDIVRWFKDAAEWVQENLGDPELAHELRSDLGLSDGQSIPENQKNQFKQFGAGLDPDKAAFEDTVAEVADLVAEFVNLGEAIKQDQTDGWEVFDLIFRVMTAESLRTRSQFVYALGKLVLLLTEDPEEIEALDPALVIGLLRGEPPPPGSGEASLQRINALTWLTIVIVEKLAAKLFDVDPRDAYEAYFGWDPTPDSSTPLADQTSARAMTFLVGPDNDVAARLSATMLVLPAEHRGPALFFSFGGGLNAEQHDGDTVIRFAMGAAGAFDLVIPFGDSPLRTAVGGDPTGWLRFDVGAGTPGKPALRIGDDHGTRLDIEKYVVGVEVGSGAASFRGGIEQAKLIIELGDGDGFLASLPGGKIEIDLGLVFTADTSGGFRIEGGTRATASLPINSSLFGVFTVHHLDVALGPSQSGRDAALEISGAFSLNLGPFKASVDRLGFLIDLGFQQGNLGVLDAAIGFKPPSGIGLALDAGIVKGGGYLYVDPVKGEYAGALELTIGPVSVKAIAILSTKLPNGADGWALLLLVYAEFAPIQLSFGFTLNGVGGMIGLHHGVDTDALTNGLRTGVLDDVLFPKDPVADAPRIINRLRETFPVTPRAFTFGPMLELGWGTPSIVIVRLGIIVQIDNALGSGPGSLDFGRFVVLGQVRVQMLPEATGTPPLLKLLVDFLGYYDSHTKRLGFVARLRDSKVAEITLTGMFVVQADFDDPSFVLSAGGFHPRFEDIPPGTPAPIDRIGFDFKIGIVSIALRGYFAVTPSTVQTGASITAKAKVGPCAIQGELGFDAIFYFEPTFHFEVDLHASISVTFKGHKLASVGFKGTLSGPGRWRISGSFSFSILWWDIEKSFDESFGSAPSTPAIETSVSSLVLRELSNEGNWAAQLPVGGQGIVSIGEISGVDGVLAHPLGRLTFTQHVAPLGLRLEKFGTSRVAGADRFDIEQVRIGGNAVAAPSFVSDSFARSQFVEMSEEQKLASPSFERFTAGFEVGSDAFTVPDAEVAADLEYETHILRPPTSLRFGVLDRVTLLASSIAMDELRAHATIGAAARSAVARDRRLASYQRAGLEVTSPQLAAVDSTHLQPVAGLVGDARRSTASAAQAIGQMSGAGSVLLVEAFEIG
ncbi:MAG: DUF6603 domain-containing protein [Ilumatobacteraceae bacterium]